MLTTVWYKPESSVEEFLAYIAKKLDKEDADISHIVSMLKGNWFTTVADLRNLTEADAEKLNIPLRLYHAIQEELPNKPEQTSYTRINTLVKTEQKDKFLMIFGCLAKEFKTSHILTLLDDWIIRNFIWLLIFVSLSNQLDWQLLATLIVQIWFTVFLAWQRPFKTTIELACNLIPEVALMIVIGMLMVLSSFNEIFVLLIVIPFLNVLVIITAVLPALFYHCI